MRRLPVAPDAFTIARYVAAYGFDPRVASDDILEAHNLPPRPKDFATKPNEFIGWQRAVFSPTTEVIKNSVPMPNAAVGIATRGGPIVPDGGTVSAASTNWSGFAANGVQGSWNTVRGYWYDPNSSAEPGSAAPDYSVMWVGIDGCGSICNADGTNVYQDGTETDRLTKPVVQYTSTFIWWEAYPYNSEQYFTATSPGDEIYCTVYKQVGSQVSANFYCKDITEGHVENATMVTGPNFIGDSVEWIVERPSESGGGTYYFTDYGTASMTEAEAVIGNTTLLFEQIPQQSSYNLYNIYMARSGPKMSTAADQGSGKIGWTWHADQ